MLTATFFELLYAEKYTAFSSDIWGVFVNKKKSMLTSHITLFKSRSLLGTGCFLIPAGAEAGDDWMTARLSRDCVTQKNTSVMVHPTIQKHFLIKISL